MSAIFHGVFNDSAIKERFVEDRIDEGVSWMQRFFPTSLFVVGWKVPWSEMFVTTTTTTNTTTNTTEGFVFTYFHVFMSFQ